MSLHYFTNKRTVTKNCFPAYMYHLIWPTLCRKFTVFALCPCMKKLSLHFNGHNSTLWTKQYSAQCFLWSFKTQTRNGHALTAGCSLQGLPHSFTVGTSIFTGTTELSEVLYHAPGWSITYHNRKHSPQNLDSFKCKAYNIIIIIM